MLQLSDREWKEFYIGGETGVFIISSGKRLTTADMDTGSIPFIGATDSNNGITNYVKTVNNTLDQNVLGVNYNGSVAETFYHPYKCIFSDDVKRLHIKNGIENRYVYLFLATIIKLQKVKFTYGYKFNANRMNRQIILLPVNESEEPDYDFMETFIKEREEIKRKEYLEYAKRKILEIRGGGTTLTTLNGVEWREFFIKDVFPQVRRGKRLIREHQTEGTTPYVSSSALNNGVDNFIRNADGVRRFNNCLSLANSGSVGSCFYEPFEFIASDHVTHLKNNDLNEYQYLFISAMLNRLSEKYNFNREINDMRISREKVLLPVDETGEPHWSFMEKYARTIIKQKHLAYVSFCENLS